MKKLVPLLLLCAHGTAGLCQDAPAAKEALPQPSLRQNGLIGDCPSCKSNTQVTPRWTLSGQYRYGTLSQDIESIDLAQSYTGSLGTSVYTQPSFKSRESIGGDLYLTYFLNRQHTLGIGLGAQFMRHNGTLSLGSFKADYQDVDQQGRTYRQIVRSNGPVNEEVTTYTLNVPLLLRFKYQFGGKSRFGVWADGGFLLGIYNQTNTNRIDGTFSYEAIYRTDGLRDAVVSGFESSPNPSPEQSLILTQDYVQRTTADGFDISAAFDRQRTRNGYNVGLNKRPASGQSTPTNSFDRISAGAMAQAGFSFEVTYRVTFDLGYYVSYQNFRNSDNSNGRLTDRLMTDGDGSAAGNYNGITNIIRRSDYLSHGAVVGLRVFLGGKGRDTDGDGWTDEVDNCKYEPGTIQGCPDNDNDQIPNASDGCPDEPGTVATNGCPDEDGDLVEDRKDPCPHDPGIYGGCPAEYMKKILMPDTTLRDQYDVRMAPHIILETDTLRFEYGSFAIQPASTSTLDNAIEALKTDPKVIIYISGYTDDIGSYANNLVLSLMRAKAAKAYLQDKGVPEDRIIVAGYGKENPLSPNDTPENRSANRRIELKLLLPLE